jgi:hypothetical protein
MISIFEMRTIVPGGTEGGEYTTAPEQEPGISTEQGAVP